MNCQQIKKALTDFIKTEVRTAGYNKVVIGVSGGIDSALVTTLAVDALGKENVIGLMLPESEDLSGANYKDALNLCRSLDIYHVTIPLTSVVNEQIIKQPDPELETFMNVDKERIFVGNFKARIRMTILYDQAARRDALVLGTTNKTELELGYYTKWGDGAVDLEPIAGLYKTEVFSLSRYLGVDENIVNKEPSADLWEGQKDTDELGSYDIADSILFWLRDMGMDSVKLMKNPPHGCTKADVVRIMSIMDKTEHKRQPPRSLTLDHSMKKDLWKRCRD